MLTKEYRESLVKQLDAMQGEVAMYYKNMVTGEQHLVSPDELVGEVLR